MAKENQKVQFSEREAARRLGLSVDQLRFLIKNHIVCDGDMPSSATFNPSDLVLLRILSGMQENAANN